MNAGQFSKIFTVERTNFVHAGVFLVGTSQRVLVFGVTVGR